MHIVYVNKNDAAATASPWIKPLVKAKPGAPSAINGQIVGGTLATAGQFPSQVNLVIDRSILCGGSLISNRWIFTAAHCLYEFVIFLICSINH
jgi:secreted trypsin-like serine protease